MLIITLNTSISSDGITISSDGTSISGVCRAAFRVMVRVFLTVVPVLLEWFTAILDKQGGAIMRCVLSQRDEHDSQFTAGDHANMFVIMLMLRNISSCQYVRSALVYFLHLLIVPLIVDVAKQSVS